MSAIDFKKLKEMALKRKESSDITKRTEDIFRMLSGMGYDQSIKYEAAFGAYRRGAIYEKTDNDLTFHLMLTRVLTTEDRKKAGYWSDSNPKKYLSLSDIRKSARAIKISQIKPTGEISALQIRSYVNSEHGIVANVQTRIEPEYPSYLPISYKPKSIDTEIEETIKLQKTASNFVKEYRPQIDILVRMPWKLRRSVTTVSIDDKYIFDIILLKNGENQRVKIRKCPMTEGVQLSIDADYEFLNAIDRPLSAQINSLEGLLEKSRN